MNKNNSLIFSLVLVLSGVIIAGGIFLYRINFVDSLKKDNIVVINEDNKINPVSEDDHILGSPNADVIIIEYSDFECPYCKEFHNMMRLAMESFGPNERLAWVYRHSPRQGESPVSLRTSKISECVSSQYGESKFWQFTNKVFDKAPSSLEENNTYSIVEELGLNSEDIRECVEGEEVMAEIQKDIDDVKYLSSLDNEFGTPYNVILTKTSEPFTFSGSIPYVMLEDIIQQNSIEF